jgi:PKD repeat protein
VAIVNQIQRYLIAGVLLIAVATGAGAASSFCPFGDSAGSGWPPPSASSVDPFGDVSGGGSSASPAVCPFEETPTGGSVDPFPPSDTSSSPAVCPFEETPTGGSVDPFPPSDTSSLPAVCPFEETPAGGSVDPFPPSDTSSSPAVCPFEETPPGGSVDPFPPSDTSSSPAVCPFEETPPGGSVDPAVMNVPCPFPDDAATDGTTAPAAACGDVRPAPLDLDGDGTYEDLNGNGRTDFADVILFFRNMDWIEENQPAGCFDYNANGNVDFADLIILFRKV